MIDKSEFVPITYRDDLLDGYMINRLGQLKNPQGMVLKGTRNTGGYLSYSPQTKSGGRVGLPAHLAVANQFIPKPDGCTIINHKDENKMNPDVDNLEWLPDSKTNTNYGTSQERRVAHRKVPINEFNRYTGKYIRTWKSSDDFGKYCIDYNIRLGKSNSFRSLGRNITNSCSNNSLAYNRFFQYYQGNINDIPLDQLPADTNSTKNKFDVEDVPSEYLYKRHTEEELRYYFLNHDRFSNYDIMLFNEYTDILKKQIV